MRASVLPPPCPAHGRSITLMLCVRSSSSCISCSILCDSSSAFCRISFNWFCEGMHQHPVVQRAAACLAPRSPLRDAGQGLQGRRRLGKTVPRSLGSETLPCFTQ